MSYIDKNKQKPIERGLAEGNDGSAGLTHPPGDGQRLVLQSALRHHLTDEAMQQSIMGRDGTSREQHFHSNLVHWLKKSCLTVAGYMQKWATNISQTTWCQMWRQVFTFTNVNSLSAFVLLLTLTFLGTARPMATAGVEQNRPTFTPGVAKVDFSVATAISQLATSWQPAAVAMPFTMATTGTGMSCISVITCNTKDKGEQ